tara:strand:+ start:633 stop:1379 length:747 start_codon:yes stop_codon:yes gene_type:complete
MNQFPNINLEIQNSNVYVYTMPYNYNHTTERRSNRRSSRSINRQNNTNEESNMNINIVPNTNTNSNTNSANSANSDTNQNNESNPTNNSVNNLPNTYSQNINPNINSVVNERATLITPTQINNQNESNNWRNSLNQVLDSSGNRNPLLNLAEALQTTFHIPVEQLQFEIIDNLPQRGSSINSLLDSTTLSLASQIMHDENDTCAICRQVYNHDDIVRKINICGHFFHSSCIEQWLRNHNNCPVCRIGI